ncbi:MAG: hypothetical protein Kow0032_05600 [Methyloligellaceae bacterium]|nr:MAG: DUF456 domain-containing protein [Alphaproteobacteria bacterium]
MPELPDIEVAYYFWVMALLFGATLAWITNFFTLPGNWIIVGLTGAFVSLTGNGDAASGLNWQAVGLLLLMAAAGEAVEFFAGAAGAAKKGASRRAMVLAMAGTLAGSITGAVMGLPVPVLGPLLGALLGGACGAFAGAYLGEMWKHGASDKSLHVGVGAAVGRLLGTLGKLAIGLVMVVVVAVRAFS